LSSTPNEQKQLSTVKGHEAALTELKKDIGEQKRQSKLK
jgi:hypothetical protein